MKEEERDCTVRNHRRRGVEREIAGKRHGGRGMERESLKGVRGREKERHGDGEEGVGGHLFEAGLALTAQVELGPKLGLHLQSRAKPERYTPNS